MKVIILTDEQAVALLSSFDSAVRGRDDFEYLVSQHGQDYTPDDIRRARRRHRDEIAVEKRITRDLLRDSESPGVGDLRADLRRDIHAAFADSSDDEKLYDALHAALTRWLALNCQSIADQISDQ